jgi:RimJ/RimL family protein N-acetyltransferase
MHTKQLLRGSQVWLAALTEDDLPTIARWYEDAGFMRLYDSRPAYPKTEKDLEKWLEQTREDKSLYAFGVRTLAEDALIGTLELDGIIWPHRVCGTALAIGDPANWGRGYGQDASRLGLRFAFDEINMHRVTATVFSYNERSMGLLERLGFQREGTYREFLQRDGQRYDMRLYGILVDEWRALQAAEE